MKVLAALLLVALLFTAFGVSHASVSQFSGLPAGISGAGVAYVNITNTITQSSGYSATSNIVYTFVYNGSGTINLTLPNYVSNVNLLEAGQPYNTFSMIPNSQCSPFIPLSQQSCIVLVLSNIVSNRLFLLSYSYNIGYPTDGGVFNSTVTFIPFAPTELRIVTVLPQGAFLQSKPYYNPSTATFSSNGHNIEVEWVFYQNTPGISLPFSVSYQENFSAQNYNSYIIAIVIVAGIIAVLLMLRRYKEQPTIFSNKKKTNPFVTLLSSEEKKVLSLLKRTTFIGQKELIDATGFSKAKMSKIISKLSRYKLIKLHADGKYNRIKRI
jgi:uncharacterized membrane protein